MQITITDPQEIENVRRQMKASGNREWLWFHAEAQWAMNSDGSELTIRIERRDDVQHG